MKRRKSKARGGRLQHYNTSMKWQMKGIGLKNTDNSKPAISVVYATLVLGERLGCEEHAKIVFTLESHIL